MKILVDARSLGQKPSGIGMYIYNFVNELKNYPDVEIGLLTDVVESDEMQKLSQEQNVRMYIYGKYVNKNIDLFSYFRYVQKMIHEMKPNIFWEGNNLVPVKIENPYGKFVVTIHDMFPFTMPECYGKVYPYYFKYGIAKTLKLADTVIYNSKETKAETEKCFPEARTKKSFLSYIIVEVDIQETMEDKNYFLYIGNLEKRKGTDILLRAYREYRMNGGDKRMILAGKIREKEIEELFWEVSGQVEGLEYAGYVDDKEKNKLLAECSCFLFPSRAEGFGMPVIEAVAYKKPVIASDLSIFKELLGDAINYFEISQDNGKAEKKLCELMQSYQENISEQNYEKVKNEYTAKVLGMKLKQYFDGELI